MKMRMLHVDAKIHKHSVINFMDARLFVCSRQTRMRPFAVNITESFATLRYIILIITLPRRRWSVAWSSRYLDLKTQYNDCFIITTYLQIT